MIKPSEIEEKQFSRAIRGYNAEEVDDFLDLIIEDLEKLQADYDKLQRENEELRTENEQHKKSVRPGLQGHGQVGPVDEVGGEIGRAHV